jgi:hypothetical protein
MKQHFQVPFSRSPFYEKAMNDGDLITTAEGSGKITNISLETRTAGEPEVWVTLHSPEQLYAEVLPNGRVIRD